VRGECDNPKRTIGIFREIELVIKSYYTHSGESMSVTEQMKKLLFLLFLV